MSTDSTTESKNIHQESAMPQGGPSPSTFDGTYGGFLGEISREGIKGNIKKFILKFIGFAAYWQEQVNAHLLREIKVLEQRVDQLERELRESRTHDSKTSLSVGLEESVCLVPPKEMVFDGSGDRFREIGGYYLIQFIELSGLKPYEKVLDVGCGIGRMAVPLTKYLNNDGLYEGFDIVPDGINWCRENISPRYSNFRFQLADVFNKFYHPQGKFQARDYRFPYEDGYFDFVFLTSVFTHMLPRDMEHYLREISRVLKKGGRCFITFFLMDREFEKRVRKDTMGQVFDFKYELDDAGAGCFVIDRNFPENAVSYAEDYIRKLFESAKLRIAEPVTYGFQDIVIAHKE